MKRTLIGDVLWLALLLIITAFLVLPQAQTEFIQLTSNYPYGMGFIKFAFLATMGEWLALRLAHRTWQRPVGMAYKVLVWGLIGVLITFMFSFYSVGVAAMMERVNFFDGNGIFSLLIPAFLTSLIMNLTFGIVFMGIHRMSDTYIEMRVDHETPSLKELIESIDWDAFISFIVFKTIPLFWIPAHTLTFMLFPAYRVVVAAYLSIVLGVILVYSNKKHDPLTGSADPV